MGRIRCEVCGKKTSQTGLGDGGKWECLECFCKRKRIDIKIIFHGSQKIEKDIDFPFADWNFNKTSNKVNSGLWSK